MEVSLVWPGVDLQTRGSATDGSCRCDIIVSSLSSALCWTSTEHQHREGMCRNEGLSSQPWMTSSFLCGGPRGPREENDTDCAPSGSVLHSFISHLPVLCFSFRHFSLKSDSFFFLKNKASCSKSQWGDTFNLNLTPFIISWRYLDYFYYTLYRFFIIKGAVCKICP